LRFNFVVVDKGSVGAVKIHDVELDAFPLGFILPSERNQSVLKNGVLFAAARVVQWNVRNFSVSAEQVRRLSVNVENRQLLATLEYVEPPLFLWLSCLCRL